MKSNLVSADSSTAFRFPSAILGTLIVISLVMGQTNSTIVELNNIHNGYKYTIKGNPSINPSGSALPLSQIEVLENTLPAEQNIQQIISTAGDESVVNLSQLSQVTELLPDSEYTEVISTRWVKKPQYSVTFILEESDDAHNMKIFELLRDHTVPYSEDL